MLTPQGKELSIDYVVLKSGHKLNLEILEFYINPSYKKGFLGSRYDVGIIKFKNLEPNNSFNSTIKISNNAESSVSLFSCGKTSLTSKKFSQI